ncbi:MAG: hypothetical protein ACI4MG_06075 [Aristaeellaceae bacterium]
MLLLTVAMVLAMSLSVVGYTEEATEAVSTAAYIFWQDSDWWPAVTNQTDDYWTPVTATVTGEGWYTVSATAHMPSWFYSGGNHNTGAQKLAVVITDGATLFPDLYMQIVDIRVDGVSYACGDVTYGQTGYDNIGQDGFVFWTANDSYGLIYDQWMLDNNGTVDTGKTWSSSAAAQQFDVFDVSVLNDPSTIEIDFFLSSQQDVRPEGGPDLRVLGEGPFVPSDYVALSDTTTTPENATTAKLYYQSGGWWPVTDGTLGVSSTVTIKGEGEYTVTASFLDQGGWTPLGNGAQKLLLIVENGADGQGTVMDGMYLGISDVRVNGVSISIGNAGYGPTGYDNGDVFGKNDGYAILYDQWQIDNTSGLPWGHKTWDGKDGTLSVINPDDLKSVINLEVDFFVTGEQGKLPEEPVLFYEYTWYPNNTMGVAGYSLRDMGISDKWYHVCPVDLTRDGIYKIPLVASGSFLIGNAIVTVEGDNVTVDYETHRASGGNLTILSECVKWFDELEDITAEFTDNPESDIAFGQAVSKAELGNVGYLFICNRVSYCQPITDYGVYLPRYYGNAPMWVAYRTGLDMMVQALQETPAE